MPWNLKIVAEVATPFSECVPLNELICPSCYMFRVLTSNVKQKNHHHYFIFSIILIGKIRDETRYEVLPFPIYNKIPSTSIRGRLVLQFDF